MLVLWCARWRTDLEDNASLAEWLDSIGVSCGPDDLIARALSHPSFVNESGGLQGSNQRLEFLGDAVLGLVVAEMLYKACPGMHEGDLTRKRAAIVREESLAQVGLYLNLGQHLRVGAGAASAGDWNRPRVLASGVEALVGAIYLLKGLRHVRSLVGRWLGPEIKRIARERQYDPKSLLQERLQEGGPAEVSYMVDLENGPPHDKVFEISVWSEGRLLGSGTGKSKKRAEQEAASDALAGLDQAGRASRKRSSGKGPVRKEEGSAGGGL